jgi:hypothetical protein
MDAVRAEHLFAGPLEIEVGMRGDVNDADRIRSQKPELLAAALAKALKALNKRADKLPSSDRLENTVRHSIEELTEIKEFIERSKDHISGPACNQLWYLSAVCLNLIHSYLPE